MLFIHLGSAVYTVTETVFISVRTKLKTKDDKSKRQFLIILIVFLLYSRLLLCDRLLHVFIVFELKVYVILLGGKIVNFASKLLILLYYRYTITISVNTMYYVLFYACVSQINSFFFPWIQSLFLDDVY